MFKVSKTVHNRKTFHTIRKRFLYFIKKCVCFSKNARCRQMQLKHRTKNRFDGDDRMTLNFILCMFGGVETDMLLPVANKSIAALCRARFYHFFVQCSTLHSCSSNTHIGRQIETGSVFSLCRRVFLLWTKNEIFFWCIYALVFIVRVDICLFYFWCTDLSIQMPSFTIGTVIHLLSTCKWNLSYCLVCTSTKLRTKTMFGLTATVSRINISILCRNRIKRTHQRTTYN